MFSRKGLAFGLLCTLFVCAALSLAAQSTSGGALSIAVISPDGERISNATVVLTNADGSAHRLTSTDDGVYSATNLPSGNYTVSLQASGFNRIENVPLAVAIGRTTYLDLHLQIASAQQMVNVSAQPAVLDLAQTSSVLNIDRDRIEELPIRSRDYLSFVLLSPQAAPANPVLANQNATTSFSFGGLRPGSNAVYIDEVSDNDEYSGGSRTQLSPEAVSDFQIVNHGFSAQAGGAAGGSIDVQTRLGTNHLHGDAFIFLQNGALSAAPSLTHTSSKPDDNRLRTGLALGGPVRRGRTFFYAAAEQEIAHGQDANDLSASTIHAINSAIANYAPLANTPLTSGLVPTEDHETELSARIDHTLTSRHTLMLRYAMTNSRNVGDAFHTDELTDPSSRGSSFTLDNGLNGTFASAINNHALNKLSIQISQRRVVDRTAQPDQPGVLIAGTALFGTPVFGNDRHFETHVELADTWSTQWRQHLLQAGARADHVAFRAHTPDAQHGLFVFQNIAALQSGSPDFYTQSFGLFDTNSAELRLAVFLQDHWTPSHSLSVDYGLRYDDNRLPASTIVRHLNISPRLGVAWTPRTSLVVRGGFGIFFDRFLLDTINRTLEFDGVHAFTQIADDTQAAAIYQSNTLPTAPIVGIAPSIHRAASSLQNPYSEVASLSAEHALPWQSTVKAEYQFVRGIHLGRTTNINLAAPVVLTSANAATMGVSSPTAQQLGRPVFSPLRNNPAFDAINLFSTSASSSHHAATLTFNRQFQENLEILAGYTWSSTFDDASSDTEQPQNPFDPHAERTLSLQDQRHRFTLSGLWLIGPDADDASSTGHPASPGLWMRMLTGLEFAPVVAISSGFRENPQTGLDSNREHIFPFAARPLDYKRNALSTSPHIDFDLRVLRMVPLHGGHLDVVAESFNVINRTNVTLLNTVFGSASTPASGFGRPIAASSARKVQLSLDYEF